MTTSNRLNSAEALRALEQGALLVDVRSLAGRAKNGEIPGAIIIAKPDAVSVFTRKVTVRSTDQKIILFCGSVAGSGPVAEELAAAGVLHVYDVEGGFSALTAEGGLTVVGGPPKLPVSA